MSKVCKIESEKIVKGNMMFQNSEIETWNSPLDKLQDGTYMFALASSFKFFRNYDNDEANEKSYCHMASLSNGRGMFKGTNVEIYGTYLDVPKLEIGASMFEEANIGQGSVGANGSNQTPGRVHLLAPLLNNGYCMFYKSQADALYLELSNLGGGADLRYFFGDTTLFCGTKVEGCERFENVSNMFDSCSGREITSANPDETQYEGVDIWLYFNEDSRAYNVCASKMFTGCTTLTLCVTFYKTIYNYYYSNQYTNTYHKNINDENFFTHLANLMDITDADGMFYCFAYRGRDGRRSVSIRETQPTERVWDKLENADYMFANCSIDYLYLANGVFKGSPNNYGMTASNMFANSIKYYSLGSASGNGCGKVTYIKGPSFCYCSDASGMFMNCTGIEKFTLKRRDTLCGEVGSRDGAGFPKGDSMFSGCTALQTFQTLRESEDTVECGYHKVSSGVDCFKGCVLRGRETLECVYHFLSACADSTIGISKQYAISGKGQQDMEYLWGVSYPTLSVAHNGGTLHFEYNTIKYV